MIHWVTAGIFLLSYRSTVWKTSTSGTPYFLQAVWKWLMFSISLNWPPVVLIFGTEPGINFCINLHRATPSLRASSKLPAGNFSPKIASIQASTSASRAGSRLPAIYNLYCWRIDRRYLVRVIEHLRVKDWKGAGSSPRHLPCWPLGRSIRKRVLLKTCWILFGSCLLDCSLQIRLLQLKFYYVFFFQSLDRSESKSRCWKWQIHPSWKCDTPR